MLRLKKTDELVKLIKEKVSLVDVMKEAGIRFISETPISAKALCFYHEEDTPSLHVSKTKNVFNCFGSGCEAGGDLVSFVRQRYKYEFVEAVKFLAQKSRIDITGHCEALSEEEKVQIRVRKGALQLAEHLHKQKGYQEFCDKRKINVQARDEFLVGYSKDFASISKGVRLIDPGCNPGMWENRIVYPVRDHYGEVCAFYTRGEGIKYLGTSNNSIIRRKGLCYGLHIARKHLPQDGTIILVEGFNDVLALHSQGIKNAIGMMGALPNKDQYETLKSLNITKILVVSDGDVAGKNASDRLLKEVPQGFKVKVAFLPDGKDPDEYVGQHGAAEFNALLHQAVSPLEYYINNLAGSVNGDFNAKIEAVRTFLARVRHLDVVERNIALLELSALIGISQEEAMAVMAEESAGYEIVEKERLVIMAVIAEPKLLEDVHGIHEEHFISAAHKFIWRSLISLRNDGVQKFGFDVTLEQVKSFGYDGNSATILGNLFERSAHSGRDCVANFVYNVKLVIEGAVRRRLITAAEILKIEASNSRSSIDQVINKHLSEVSNTVVSSDVQVVEASTQVEGALEYINERMKSPGKIPGVDLGPKWSTLMQNVLGFDAKRMIMVAASPKAGKTTLAQNWAMNIAVQQKIPTLWINLEMSEQDLVLRNLSILSGVSNMRLRLGQITPEEKDVVERAAKAYYNAPLYALQGAKLLLSDIISATRKYVVNNGVKIVFLDYVQLIRIDDSRMEWWAQNAKISTALRHDLSGGLGVPLIAISQLEKQAAKEGMTGGSYGAGSAKYGQDCDCWLGLRAKTPTEMETPGNMMLNIDFSRIGPQGVCIPIYMNHDNLRMVEAN